VESEEATQEEEEKVMPKGKRRKKCLKGKKPAKRQHKHW